MSANAPAPAVSNTPQAPGMGYFVAPAAIAAMTSMGNAYSQAGAARAQGQFTERVGKINAEFTKLRGEDAVRRGEKEAARKGLETRKLIGRQRAALGAQGVRLDYGTPLEAQEETAAFGALDILTIRNNAWREAWGYQVSALDQFAQADFAGQAARSTARQTLLTGGLAAARDTVSGFAAYRRGR